MVCAGVWWPLLTDSPRFGLFVSLYAGVCCAILADIGRFRGFPVVLSIFCCQLLVILADPGWFCAFPAQLSLSYGPLIALRVGSRPIVCVSCSFAPFLAAIDGLELQEPAFHQLKRSSGYLFLSVIVECPRRLFFGHLHAFYDAVMAVLGGARAPRGASADQA